MPPPGHTGLWLLPPLPRPPFPMPLTANFLFSVHIAGALDLSVLVVPAARNVLPHLIWLHLVSYPT